MAEHPELETDIGKVVLKNPVMTASGTFGYAGEYAELIDLNRLGGIIVKGLSLAPSKGNPPPRIAETPCGMLNAIGLENVGIDVFEKEPYDGVLLSLSNVLATPHLGSCSKTSRLAMELDAAKSVDNYLRSENLSHRVV